MSSIWGETVKMSIFGESHGKAIGVVLDGLPAGEPIDFDAVALQMSRRAPGRDSTSTPRRESDLPQMVSGILNERTTGAPLCALIENTNTKSGDYDNLKRVPRPGHADFPAHLRYGGFNDVRRPFFRAADSPTCLCWRGLPPDFTAARHCHRRAYFLRRGCAG